MILVRCSRADFLCFVTLTSGTEKWWARVMTLVTLGALLSPDSITVMLFVAITFRLLRSVLVGRMNRVGALASVSAVVTPCLIRFDPFTFDIMICLAVLRTSCTVLMKGRFRSRLSRASVLVLAWMMWWVAVRQVLTLVGSATEDAAATVLV